MPSCKCILTEQLYQSNSSNIVPIAFEITKQPNKVNYSIGDTFDITGLEGIISYGISGSTTVLSTAKIPDNISLDDLRFNPSRALEKTDIEVTISYTENRRTVNSNVQIIVKEPFVWGNESEVGDAEWWAGLKNWAINATEAEREACIGKKKKVALLGVSILNWLANAKISTICIGADIDGPNTLTFQTEGCSPNSLSFGAENARYSASNVLGKVNTFVINCSASHSVKSIIKLTCESEPNRTQTQIANTESTQKGFLPSDCEMGFIAGADNSQGKGYAMSYQEWAKDGSQKPYQYYTSNTSRIKYKCSSNGDLTTTTVYYWERSSTYDVLNRACVIRVDGSPFWLGNISTNAYLAPAFVIG